jgi:hypothetical protein
MRNSRRIAPPPALFIVLALGVTWLPGCSHGGCDDYAAPGVDVEVVDGRTGQDICAASVTLTDGSYVEIVSAIGTGLSDAGTATCLYPGAFERPGTYDVGVSAAGYQPSGQDGVVAGAGTCHVQTAHVTIQLAQ